MSKETIFGYNTGPKGLWNKANCFTAARLPLAVIGMWVYASFTPGPDSKSWGVVVIAVAGATDWFDGQVARRFGAVSEFGAVLDPIVDKLTALTVGLFAYSVFDDGSRGILRVVLLIEVAILVASVLAKVLYYQTFQVSKSGKRGIAARGVGVLMLLWCTAVHCEPGSSLKVIGSMFALGGVLIGVFTLLGYTKQLNKPVSQRC